MERVHQIVFVEATHSVTSLIGIHAFQNHYDHKSDQVVSYFYFVITLATIPFLRNSRYLTKT